MPDADRLLRHDSKCNYYYWAYDSSSGENSTVAREGMPSLDCVPKALAEATEAIVRQ